MRYLAVCTLVLAGSVSLWPMLPIDRTGLGFLTISSLAYAAPVAAQKTSADKSVETINPDFRTPQRLRGRVDFWKDVFSRYSKYQIIIHHRDFPQVRFGLVDLKDEAKGMSDGAYDTFKKKRVDAAIDEIKKLFQSLSDGHAPRTEAEKFIATKMVIVPGGTAKYQSALDNDLIRSQTGMYEKFGEAIQRSGRYMKILEKVFVQDYGLPKELTRLPFVESSFDYEAYSSVGAAGIWQFMPGTARHYSMMVNPIVDERRDPLESTNAAAQYFAHAYNQLGTWPLAVISYNHGVAGVLKKVRAEGSTDLGDMIERPFDKRPFGFASSNFYPSLLAAIEVYNDRKTLYPNVHEEPGLQLTKVRLSGRASIQEVSKRLGVSRDTLKLANFALMDSVWDGKALIPAGYVLKVPQRYEQKVEQLASNIEIPSNVPAKQAPQKQLDVGKNVPTKTPVAKTSTGLSGKVAQQAKTQTKTGAKTLPTKKKIAPPITTVYKARTGDTLWSIARQNKLNVADLVRLNPTYKKNLKPGQLVKIPK